MTSLSRPIVAAAAAMLALGATAAVAQDRFRFDATPGRLSKDVVPTRYAIALRVDPAAPRFDGSASIDLRVRRRVGAIVLHAEQLLPASAQLVVAGGARRTLTVTADAATQTWRLTPQDGRAIGAGTARLALAWSGSVSRSGEGLFAAPYRLDGQPQTTLGTQLEAIYARRVFPGFDEPAFRAVFELSVTAPPAFDVVANMPRADRSAQPDGAVRHRFRPTPSMPSYLLAFAVGRFDALDGSAAGVPLRILTPPGKRTQGAYALRATEQLLPYYNGYFGVPFALPKLDQIAMPSGRDGAMEDWGLISYAESALLLDPATGSAQTERRVFEVVAHEVAHQWFGNLVTAAWWDEIWLNEAFATWMAEKAAHRFNPQWQLPLNRRREIDSAMQRDAGSATRAIRSGAVSEDRVFDVFDDISYTKGGAVLSMIEGWVGEDAFRRGLAAYMRERAYSNATAGDLWHHIGRAARRDVSGVVAGWTDRQGFPLIGVASRCDGGQTVVDVSQRRFLTGGGADATLWKVPLTLQFGGAAAEPRLLDGERATFRLPGCPAAPLLVNASGAGYYRVAYAPEQRRALLLGYATLPATARAALLSDALALAQAGQQPLADVLPLLAAVAATHGPEQPALIGIAQSVLSFMDHAFAGTPAQAALRQTARALLAPELAAIGWDAAPGEDSERARLRLGLIQDLARYGDPRVLEQARAMFDADQSGARPLAPATRASVVYAAGVGADAARLAQLAARLKAAASEEDRWMYMSAIGAVRDPALTAQVLALALDPAVQREQALWLPGNVAGTGPAQSASAYRWMLQNFPALAERAGSMLGSRSWLLPSTLSRANDPALVQQLVADQERLLGAPGRANAARVADAVTLNAAVKAREAERIVPALEALTGQLAKAGS